MVAPHPHSAIGLYVYGEAGVEAAAAVEEVDSLARAVRGVEAGPAVREAVMVAASEDGRPVTVPHHHPALQHAPHRPALQCCPRYFAKTRAAND